MEDVKAKLRLALASLKDQAAIGRAVISAQDPVSADIEVAILRCTAARSDSSAPVEDRYVNELLSLVAHAPGSAASLARKLTRRLDTAQDPVVALKTLLLLHRLLRGGDRRFELDIRGLYLSGGLRLGLQQRFSADPSWCSSFRRCYAEFLEERTGWVINPAGKLEPAAGPSPEQYSSAETALQRLSRCQAFLDKAMACLPESAAASRRHHVTQSAMNIILRESFPIYASFCESFEAVVGSFQEYKSQRRALARSVARKAASQSLRLQGFYEDCKRVVVGRNLEYPRVRVITVDEVSAMDGFLGCSGTAGGGRPCPPRESRLSGAASSCDVKRVELLGGCDGGGTMDGGFDALAATLFSCRLETKISTEWVAFDEEDDCGNSISTAGAAEDGCLGSANDLLLSWKSFDDR